MEALRFATGLLILTALADGQAWSRSARVNLRLIEGYARSLAYRMYPNYATYYGDYQFNDLLRVYTEQEQLELQGQARGLLDVMSINVDREELSDFDKVNYDVIKNMVETYLNGSAWAQYGSLTPMTLFEGIQLYAADLAITRTRGDFENFIARLEKIPAQVDEIKAFCRLAISLDRTLHNVTIFPVLQQLEDAVDPRGPEYSSYYFFGATLNNSNVADEATRESIRERGTAAIIGLNKAFTNLKKFLEKRYIPATRTAFGVDSWDPEYYTACLKWHLSDDVTPEEIHELGLTEVRRITRLMKRTMRRLNFTGTIREFFDSLSDDPRFVTSDTDKIVKRYERTIRRIQRKLDDYFDEAPDYAMQIVPRTGGVFAGYSPVTETSPGRFYINVARPEDHTTYEMMALSLHEALPGHHLQFSYILDSPLPDVRKNLVGYSFDVPNAFPIYTAHVEGWGLYSEYLGEEMGLYEDDYELMGRYSYEIFRAARLVVDTGLHHYGWTQQEAVDYMVERSAFNVNVVENEIIRYITLPGQATAYKYGEIFIRRLRDRAEEFLGSQFNIKSFHKIFLEYGTLPLSTLEKLVDDWMVESLVREL